MNPDIKEFLTNSLAAQKCFIMSIVSTAAPKLDTIHLDSLQKIMDIINIVSEKLQLDTPDMEKILRHVDELVMLERS